MISTGSKPSILLAERGLEETRRLLEKNKFKVSVAEGRIIPTDKSIDLYVFRLKDHYLFKSIANAVEIIKAKQPNSKVLFCGELARLHTWKTIFETEADYACIGDDDPATILELCQNWGGYLGSITGLAERTEAPQNGIFLCNKRPKGL